MKSKAMVVFLYIVHASAGGVDASTFLLWVGVTVLVGSEYEEKGKSKKE